MTQELFNRHLLGKAARGGHGAGFVFLLEESKENLCGLFFFLGGGFCFEYIFCLFVFLGDMFV